MHATAGFDVRDVEVQTETLKAVCDKHAQGRVIDFLKIDVEGAEADVVASADWSRYRPRIVLIEATVPLSPEVSYLDWEPTLLGAGYMFCYFDGLNRWYVREEEPALREAFHSPPNPFDGYRLAEVVDLERKLSDASLQLKTLKEESESLKASLQSTARNLMRKLY